MIVKLNLLYGTEAPPELLDDVTKANKLPIKIIKELLDKVIKLRILKTITYDEFKEWEKKIEISKANIRAGAGLFLWIINRTLKEKLNKEQLMEDFKKIGLKDEITNILSKYIEKNREEISNRIFRGKGLTLSTLSGISWRLDYKIQDKYIKEIYSPSIILSFSIDDQRSNEEINELFEVDIDVLKVIIDILNEALIQADILEKNKNKITENLKSIFKK